MLYSENTKRENIIVQRIIRSPKTLIRGKAQ